MEMNGRQFFLHKSTDNREKLHHRDTFETMNPQF